MRGAYQLAVKDIIYEMEKRPQNFCKLQQKSDVFATLHFFVGMFSQHQHAQQSMRLLLLL